MIFLNPEIEIPKIISKGSPCWYKRALEIYDNHVVHINGNGLANKLKRLSPLENKENHEKRILVTTPGSISVSAPILAQFDNIFHARGGSVRIENSNKEKEKELLNLLLSINEGDSLRKFLSHTIREKFFFDPNGVVLLEYEYENDSEEPSTPKHEIEYYCIKEILNYEKSGNLKLEWLCFQPKLEKDETGKETGNKVYRFIDDANDYTVIWIKALDNYIIVPFTYFPLNGNIYRSYRNNYTEVPGVVIGDLPDFENDDCYTTHISDILPTLDEYLYLHSDKQCYAKSIALPLRWQYPSVCPDCNGTGRQGNDVCPTCKGSRTVVKNSILEVLKIPIPMTGEPSIIPPAGFVIPDLESLREMKLELKDLKQIAYEAKFGLGSFIGANDTTTTATEINFRSQVIDSVLNSYSSFMEKIHERLVRLLCYFLEIPETLVSVKYGREYGKLGITTLLERFNSGVSAKIPSTQLINFWIEYISELYINDPIKLKEETLKVQIKPFPFSQLAEIQTLSPDKRDYYGNMYFDEFLAQYPKSIGSMKYTDVKTDFDKFIDMKISNLQILESNVSSTQNSAGQAVSV